MALLVALAGMACILYCGSKVARRLLSLLALGAVVFPALFLWTVAPRESARADASPVVSPAPDSVPVVFVVFDELPLASLLEDPRTVDAVRFPNFAAFASTSAWFRHATTVAQTTRTALPAMVTGRYPSGNKPPTAEGHPVTLFSLATGRYNLNVVETTTALCGRSCEDPVAVLSWIERMRPALADLGAIYLALVLPGVGPAVGDTWGDYWGVEFAAPPTEEGSRHRGRHPAPSLQLERFLWGLERSPRTTLHFLHLMVPHVPWVYLPDGHAYVGGSRLAHGLGPADSGWVGSEWEIVQAQQRHLIQLQYADGLLGRIVAGLRDRELFDASLIVVTADHGTSFETGQQRRFLTQGSLVDIAHVPLFVKRPGQRVAEVSDKNVETIDIALTIAAAMGVDLPGPLDGLELFAGRERGSTKTIFRGPGKAGKGERWAFATERLTETWDHVRTRADRFPEASLYTIGADRHLVGRRVQDLERRPARASSVLENPGAFDAVDPEAWILPVHVMGRLAFTEEIEQPQRLAVALDGVIRAVTETYGALPTEEAGFSALLDPAVLRAGSQELKIYLLEAGSSISPATER